MAEIGSGEKGPSLFGRVKRLFTAAGGEHLPPSSSTAPDTSGLSAANKLDEANRTFGFRGDGSPKMTAPTAGGLANTQESAPPTPPLEPTQGK